MDAGWGGCGLVTGLAASGLRLGSSLKIWKPAPALLVAEALPALSVEGAGTRGVGFALDDDDDDDDDDEEEDAEAEADGAASPSENMAKAGAAALSLLGIDAEEEEEEFSSLLLAVAMGSEWMTKAAGCLHLGGSPVDAEEVEGTGAETETGLAFGGTPLVPTPELLLLLLLLVVLEEAAAGCAAAAASVEGGSPAAAADDDAGAAALCLNRGSLISLSCSEAASLAEAR
jgi:hypothetical protein